MQRFTHAFTKAARARMHVKCWTCVTGHVCCVLTASAERIELPDPSTLYCSLAKNMHTLISPWRAGSNRDEEQHGDKQDSQATEPSANTPFAHIVMHNHHQNILFILYLCCKQRKHWFYLSTFTTQHQQYMQQQDIYFCFLCHITWI